MERLDSYKGLMGKYVFIYRTSTIIDYDIIVTPGSPCCLLFVLYYFLAQRPVYGAGNLAYYSFINSYSF